MLDFNSSFCIKFLQQNLADHPFHIISYLKLILLLKQSCILHLDFKKLHSTNITKSSVFTLILLHKFHYNLTFAQSG